MKSYCVKQKKVTECTEPSGYKTTKNGKLMFFCTCAECGIKRPNLLKNRETKQPVRDGRQRDHVRFR